MQFWLGKPHLLSVNILHVFFPNQERPERQIYVPRKALERRQQQEADKPPQDEGQGAKGEGQDKGNKGQGQEKSSKDAGGKEADES